MGTKMRVNSVAQARTICEILTVRGKGCYRIGADVVVENVSLSEAFVIVGSTMAEVNDFGEIIDK